MGKLHRHGCIGFPACGFDSAIVGSGPQAVGLRAEGLGFRVDGLVA